MMHSLFLERSGNFKGMKLHISLYKQVTTVIYINLIINNDCWCIKLRKNNENNKRKISTMI